jgi:hypothetical protein
MVGDARADEPCKNANLYVINKELNALPWEPPLRKLGVDIMFENDWPMPDEK